jgi:hypothetical protein
MGRSARSGMGHSAHPEAQPVPRPAVRDGARQRRRLGTPSAVSSLNRNGIRSPPLRWSRTAAAIVTAYRRPGPVRVRLPSGMESVALIPQCAECEIP